MYQSNRSFNIPLPPGNLPGIWFFGIFFSKFPPPRAKKVIKCPHLRETYLIIQHKESQFLLARGWKKVGWDAFNCWTKYRRKSGHISYKHIKSSTKHTYKTKLVYAFAFHESAIFSLEYIKVCRHDLSTYVESARLVTWNRG